MRGTDTQAETPRTREQLADAIDRYNAMSPVDQALCDSDQRMSFVAGNRPLDEPDRERPRDVLADEVRRLRSDLAAATARAERAEAEQAKMREFLAEAAAKSGPVHGYTALDFMKLWWEQEKAANADLRAKLAACERDAERYRWLRDMKVGYCDNPYTSEYPSMHIYSGWLRVPAKAINKESLDAAIDAAIAAQRKEDGQP